MLDWLVEKLSVVFVALYIVARIHHDEVLIPVLIFRFLVDQSARTRILDHRSLFGSCMSECVEVHSLILVEILAEVGMGFGFVVQARDMEAPVPVWFHSDRREVSDLGLLSRLMLPLGALVLGLFQIFSCRLGSWRVFDRSLLFGGVSGLHHFLERNKIKN